MHVRLVRPVAHQPAKHDQLPPQRTCRHPVHGFDPWHDARGYPMPDERLEVSVTFDERGYIASAPELRSAVVALSLGGLRRKIEALMVPDDVRVVLQLDGLLREAGLIKS